LPSPDVQNGTGAFEQITISSRLPNPWGVGSNGILAGHPTAGGPGLSLEPFSLARALGEFWYT